MTGGLVESESTHQDPEPFKEELLPSDNLEVADKQLGKETIFFCGERSALLDERAGKRRERAVVLAIPGDRTLHEALGPGHAQLGVLLLNDSLGTTKLYVTRASSASPSVVIV